VDGLIACDFIFQINKFNRSQSASARPMTVEDVALGFVQVANEAMCRPIRALTQVAYAIIAVGLNMLIFL